MGTTQSDVTLLIRARAEVDNALAGIAKLLGAQSNVATGAGETNSKLIEQTKALLTLDRAAGQVADAINKASTATSRQATTLHSTTAQINEQKDRVETLVRALGLLKKEADDAFVGPRRDGLADTLKSLEGQLGAAESKISKLGRTLDKQVGGFQKSRSSLTAMRQSSAELAEGQEKAREAIERTTAAIDRQNAISIRASGAQSFFNAKAGPARSSAVDNGATFDALAAQEQESAIREATHAHELFEARVRSGVAALKEEEAAAKGVAAAEQAEIKRQAAEAYAAFEARVRSGVSALKESEAAERADAAAVTQLRGALDPVAAIYERMNAQLERYHTLQQSGKITSEEFAAAQTHLAAEAKKTVESLSRNQTNAPKVSLFGLEPYQTQNLFYQINDVVTQLSSGTSLSQTLAQQGGQIFQLFQNRVGPAIVAALTNPAILSGIAGFVALSAALYEAAQQSERLRQIQGAITANANGDLYDADKLQRAAQAMSQFGVSATEATAAVKVFIQEGIAPERLEQFIRTAQNAADVMGIKLPDAAKQVSDAFTGGYDAVVKLDDATNFLTGAQRDNIRALFDSGNAAKARSEAFDIFSQKQNEAATAERGPWSDAVRQLSGAWESFLNLLGNNTIVNTVGAALDGLVTTATSALNTLANSKQIQEVTDTINALTAARDASLASGEVKPGSAGDAALQKLIDRNKAQRDALIHGTPVPGASNPGDTVNGGVNSAQAKSAGDVNTELKLQQELANLQEQRDQVLTGGQIARRLELTRTLAIMEEMRASGNATIAQEKGQLAVDRERVTTARQQQEAQKAAASEREAAIQQFAGRVIGAEGGSARNPKSSASGFGQFTEGTFIDQAQKVYGTLIAGMSREQVLALRNDEGVARGVIDNYARENARFLESFGQKVTAGNLYLAHFLGPAGAKDVLTANANTPVNQVGLSAAALSGNQGYLRTDNGKGRYRTAGELQTFIGGRVGDSGQAQTAGIAAISKLVDDAAQKQDDLNLAIAKENETRGETIQSLTRESGLREAALLAAERQAAVEKAILDLRQKAADINKGLKEGQAPVTISDAQLATTAVTTAQAFDAAHVLQTGESTRAPFDRNVGDLAGQRSAIQEQMAALQIQGQIDIADQLRPQLASITDQLHTAIEASRAFYASLDGLGDQELYAKFGLTRDGLKNIEIGLQTASVQAHDLGSYLGIQFLDVEKKFADGAAGAFDKFSQSVAQGAKVFPALKDAFLQFASSFLEQLAQMIEQQILFNLVSQAFSIIGFGAGAGVGAATGGGGIGAFSAGVMHDGGVAGSPGKSRSVNPAWFTQAARFHSGGIVGLRPDEVPAILQRGEEVLTAADARHRANGGGGSSGDVNATFIAVYDSAEALKKALATPAGSKAIIAHLRENSGAVNSVLSR